MSSSSLQAWISEHKLTSIGALWASGIGASLVRSRKTLPAKTSLRLIHARMHAQALTLAVLSSAALMHYYYENHGGAVADEGLGGERTVSRNKSGSGEAAAGRKNVYDMLNMVI